MKTAIFRHYMFALWILCGPIYCNAQAVVIDRDTFYLVTRDQRSGILSLFENCDQANGYILALERETQIADSTLLSAERQMKAARSALATSEAMVRTLRRLNAVHEQRAVTAEAVAQSQRRTARRRTFWGATGAALAGFAVGVLVVSIP